MSAIAVDSFEWLERPLAELQMRRSSGRMPHALLITGVRGLGKSRLADLLARCLLCEKPSPDGAACGECGGCTLSNAGSHPDLRLVSLEEGKQDISVEHIRELTRFLALTSQRGCGKVAIIRPSERMNVNAFNALLKTLEEPVPGTYLVLVTSVPGRLPATIRSRCQRVTLPAMADSEVRRWLDKIGKDAPDWVVRQSEGAPLRAVELLGSETMAIRSSFLAQLQGLVAGRVDVTAICEGLDTEQTRDRLAMLVAWTQDMVRFRLTATVEFTRNADIGMELASLASGVETRELFRRLERAETASRLTETSVNRQLLLENSLLPWC